MRSKNEDAVEAGTFLKGESGCIYLVLTRICKREGRIVRITASRESGFIVSGRIISVPYGEIIMRTYTVFKGKR